MEKTIITLDSCIHIQKSPRDNTNIKRSINIFKTYKQFLSILTSFEGSDEVFVHVFRTSGYPVVINPIDLSSCKSYVKSLYFSIDLGFLSEIDDNEDADVMLEKENFYVFINTVYNSKLELVII